MMLLMAEIHKSFHCTHTYVLPMHKGNNNNKHGSSLKSLFKEVGNVPAHTGTARIVITYMT
jgi:hypothetical protein